MSRICLDTSAYSNFKRGDGSATAIIDAADWVGVPAIVLGELRAGFALGRRPRAHESELGRFLANPAVQVLDVDDEASRIYSDIVVLLRKSGTPVPTNDIWIAACAAATHSVIVTFDDHFRHVRRVGRVLLG